MSAPVQAIKPVPVDVWIAWLRSKAAHDVPVVLSPKAARELADLIEHRT